MEKLDKNKLIAYGLVLVGALVYISLIFNNNVWLDEAFTANLVGTNMQEVIQRSASDTLPPLYNILLKIMVDIFGYNVQIMKLTSLLPMVLTMMLGAAVVRKRFGNVVSYVFIISMFVMPQFLFYGVEVRMYSWGFFFVTGSGIFAYEIINTSCLKNWIIFVLLSVGAGYTHHFAFVAVGFIYLFLLIYYCVKDRAGLRQWILGAFAIALLYLPCFLNTLKQIKRVSGYFTMPEVTLKVFVKYLRYPYTVGVTVISVLLLLAVLALLIRLIFIKKKEPADWYALLCILVYYCVLCFGTVASKLMTANIFVDRYLFPSMGLIWLFFAIQVGRLSKKALYAVGLLLVLVGIAGYKGQWSLEYVKGLETMQTYFDENISASDILLVDENEGELEMCMQFYYPELLVYNKNTAADIADADSTMWYVLMEGKESELAQMLTGEYKAEFCGDFNFDRYKFKLYKLRQL